MEELKILTEERLIACINEERGISDTVVKWSRLIINVLETRIKRTKSELISRNYVTYKHGETNVDLGKINLPIRWFYYNFMDETTKNENLDLLRREPNGMNKNGLSITIFSVDGKIDTDSFENTIGHELLHLFQADKSQKIFSNTHLYKEENEWKGSTNKFLKLFGNILYLSHKFEEDAYNHGLYMSLISCKWHDELYKRLKEDQTYYIIEYLTNAVNELSDADKDNTELKTALEVIQKYNYNLEKIIKIANNSINRFNKLLARTYEKAERDWKKENMISEFYNFKLENSNDIKQKEFLENIIN